MNAGVIMNNENTSGHGEYSSVPVEIKGWNWGAFWLTWIWGISNRTYISFLAFVPVINFFIPFYLGSKGNELSWKNREWTDTEKFKEEQKIWTIAGWTFAVIIVLCIGIQWVHLDKMDQISENIKNQVMEVISKNPEAKKLIGTKYTIPMEPAIQSASTSYGDFPVSHTFFICNETESILVNTVLKEDYSIQEITLIPDEGASIIIRIN